MGRFRNVVMLGAAVLALGATAVPVRADFQVMHSFAVTSNGPRGLVMAERPRDPDAATKLYVALAGLTPGHHYRLVESSDACSVPVGTTHEIFSRRLTAKANGSVVVSASIQQRYADFSMARSARLMEEEGIFYFCRAINGASAAGASVPDGANAHFVKKGYRGSILIHESATNRVSTVVSLSKLGVRMRFQIIHSPLTCSQFNEGDPDQPIVIGSFRSDSNGLAEYEREQEADVMQALSKGSYRIARPGSTSAWACANLTSFVDD